MKQKSTQDYVAPECEIYSMIPEKGFITSSESSFETEEPEIEIW